MAPKTMKTDKKLYDYMKGTNKVMVNLEGRINGQSGHGQIVNYKQTGEKGNQETAKWKIQDYK